MSKQKNLDLIKKEFSEDIEKQIITIDDLKKWGVSKQILQSEIFLRKYFGGEIYSQKKTEEKIVGEKEVIKLTEEDIAFDSQVREICDNLVDYEFDNNVGVLLSKVEEEDEED